MSSPIWTFPTITTPAVVYATGPAITTVHPIRREIVLCKHGKAPCDACGTIVVFR